MFSRQVVYIPASLFENCFHHHFHLEADAARFRQVPASFVEAADFAQEASVGKEIQNLFASVVAIHAIQEVVEERRVFPPSEFRLQC